MGLAAASVAATSPRAAVRWGRDGHEMVGYAAAQHLPDDMPAFFRDAADQLAWLNYDPDRWRNDRMVESNEAWQYDHFIDLEAVPDFTLEARNRFMYLIALERSGISNPEQMGLLPFRIIEMTQRLTQEFRQWRTESDPRVRQWLEQRVINDAGILGHYVADGANPHHTTIHFNGWNADSPNPEGYTLDRTFHRRFESDYVSSHIDRSQVVAAATAAAGEIADLRAGVLTYLRRTNSTVRRLYELEKQESFSERTQSPAHEAFTVERLAAGADMLRSIWYTAWRDSATE